MDLNLEILESYARIHNRVLSQLLSEGDTNADPNSDPRITTANGVLAGAQWQQDGASQSASLTKADGAATEATLWTNGSIAIGGANAKWDGQTLSPGKNPEQFKKILTMLAGPEEGEAKTPAGGEETTTEGQVEEVPVQALPGDMTYQADLEPETQQATANNLVAAAARASEIWKTLTKAQQKQFGPEELFSRFFAGGRSESFEKQLVGKKVTIELKHGEWQTIVGPPQDAQTSRISDSMRDLVAMVADDKCDEDVLADFAQTKKGDVLISPKGDQDDRTEALAFKDNKGFLKMLLDKASKACGKKIPIVKLRRAKKTVVGGDNAVRGFAFEDILEVISLLRMRKELGDSPELSALIDAKMNRIHEKLSRLTLSKELWIKAYNESGLDPSVVATIRDIGDILQGGAKTNDLYGSMMRHSDQSVRVRGSIYALPVGDQVGLGKRQDVLELFASPEEALAGAERSGITGIKAQCGPVEDAFTGDHAATLDALKSVGAFTDGQEVCGLKVSLKNYQDLAHAIFGGGRYTTFKELLSDMDSPFAKVIMENLGMTEDDMEGFQNYAQEMDDIGGTIHGLPMEMAVTTTAKGTINHNSANSLAKNIIDDLSMDSTYPELQQGDKKRLIAVAKRIAQKSGTAAEARVAYKKLQTVLAQTVHHRKLQRDIENGSQPGSDDASKEKARSAKLFIGFKMFHSGGSDDDDSLCDFRGLKTDENYIFKQNDILRDSLRSVLGEDGEWDIKFSAGGQINLESEGDMKLSLLDSVVTNKNKAGKDTSYAQNISLQVSRGTQKAYDTTDNDVAKKANAKKAGGPKELSDSKRSGLIDVLGQLKLLVEKIAVIGI
tara:strand:+ start:3105 stop:5621 length:2517 start_codon:yes stop_codon:yes gene_type:complete